MRVDKEMEVTYKSGYIRFYKEEDIHEVDPAECIMTFNLESRETMIISGLFGKWSKDRYTSFFRYVKSIGVKRVLAHCPTPFKPVGFEPWNDMMIINVDDVEV